SVPLAPVSSSIRALSSPGAGGGDAAAGQPKAGAAAARTRTARKEWLRLMRTSCGEDLFHGSIRQCPEVGEYLRPLRGIHHSLGEEEADPTVRRIGGGGGAEAAGPAETAGDVEDLPARDVDGHPECPTAVGAEEDLGPCALLGRQLIAGHQLHARA